MKKYHHVTVGDGKGKTIRTINFGSNIKARIAYPEGSRPTGRRAKRGKGKGNVITLLFSPHAYTLSEAKDWARSHGYRIKGTAMAGTTEKRLPKRRTSAKRPKKAIKRRGTVKRCDVCRKPMKPQIGAGRPRLRHKQCQQ